MIDNRYHHADHRLHAIHHMRDQLVQCQPLLLRRPETGASLNSRVAYA